MDHVGLRDRVSDQSRIGRDIGKLSPDLVCQTVIGLKIAIAEKLRALWKNSDPAANNAPGTTGFAPSTSHRCIFHCRDMRNSYE
jgi:hypothetical protein